MRKKLLIFMLFVSPSVIASIAKQGGVWGGLYAQINYAKQMAATIMNQYKDSMVVKKYASHLEQDKLPEGNRPANWNYEIGVVLMGFERLGTMTGDKTYMEYAKHIVDHFIKEDGTIRTYVMDEYNSDNVPPGRQLLRLHELYKEEKYKIAAQTLRDQISWQPRNKTGGFWHKLKYPSQMWLDGLYMLQPFYAEYAVVNKQPGDFNDIINQFVWMEKYGRDAKTGLLYHGWDESRLQRWADPKTGLSPEFWSRSMGWYMMALVDVLDFIPQTHPRRSELIKILNRLTTAIVKFQDVKSGVWWQVTDKANKEKNYLESSGTAMFVFAMAKGIRLKYLPQSFTVALKKAYDGMIKEFVKEDANGKYHYVQAVAGAGLGGTPYRDGTYEYYVNEPRRDDDLKAIGPFIQACIEIELLKTKK
ncbi:MAG: glycoside hydrolase family 88 protein [Chitinophagaceae bacterium]|nr:glycoside hydrolase family 88 protein [Chitinophagaceae bacterium]